MSRAAAPPRCTGGLAASRRARRWQPAAQPDIDRRHIRNELCLRGLDQRTVDCGGPLPQVAAPLLVLIVQRDDAMGEFLRHRIVHVT